MLKNKLIGWFFIWFAIMILVVFITQPETRKSKLDTISFDTTESAELYFNNVRSFYYTMDEEGYGNFDAYRFKAMYANTSHFALRFVIYNSWRQNMAFIRVDTNFTNIDQFEYLVSTSVNGDLDTIFFPDQYNESQFSFAKTIFLAAKENHQIGLPRNSDTLWISDSDKVHLRKTLRDYFKLVGKL